MSQTTTPVVPIRPTAAVAPQSWPAGPYPACPPDAFSAMARLMSCYEDVRLATEFLSKVMTDIIENNPAVTTAIVEAIQKAGSNLPTIGVTDGSNAQPGQVGEWIRFSQTAPYTVAGQTQSVSMGVLQPGDWDCMAWAGTSTATTNLQFYLNPVPTGFSDAMNAIIDNEATNEAVNIVSLLTRASLTVPTLVVLTLVTNNSATPVNAGNATLTFVARRAR